MFGVSLAGACVTTLTLVCISDRESDQGFFTVAFIACIHNRNNESIKSLLQTRLHTYVSNRDSLALRYGLANTAFLANLMRCKAF